MRNQRTRGGVGVSGTLGALAFLLAASPATGMAAPPDTTWTFDGAMPAGVRGIGETAFAPDEHGGGLRLDGVTSFVVVAESTADRPELRPADAFTASAWVAVDRTTRWGGIVGCVQDNGGYEKGWILGYDQERFTFGISTEGGDDGDGSLAYVRGTTDIEPGRWYHVAATWDGTVATLIVDGTPEGTLGDWVGGDDPTDHGGPILHDDAAPFVIGGYVDANERYALDGRISRARLEHRVRTAAELAERVAASKLAELPAWVDPTPRWMVPPYLTWPTLDGVSVLFETRAPTDATVRVWPAGRERDVTTWRSGAAITLHEFVLRGLEPDTKYFYEVACTSPPASAEDGDAASLEFTRRSFRTAATEGSAFSFVAIGDTQSQPEVVRRVAAESFMTRPSFTVIAGDLVTTGGDTSHWTGHFFPNMRPLIEHAPMLTVLGNHEQDAKQYYDYLSLPTPERWYTATYGNAEFFMIDGNRPLGPESEQYRWLEGALAASTAQWRFAVMHQPPYTSDADDYGNTKEGASNQGDMNARSIVPLFERYGVDICFSGHVHDYERTFPVREGKTARWEDGGVIYVTTAGGGGHLEDFDPSNTWFGHRKRRTHHLVYVAINGRSLEYQAIDERGALFDVMFLEKPADGGR